ncbi:MAG: hypothetical protein ACTSRP_15490, partial [Candidatus Helarchaeota archaeon]
KYFEVTIGSGNLTELGNGIYYFNLNSSCLSIGTYYIIISCSDYGFVSTQLVLKVNPIKINITYQSSFIVYSGNSKTIEIWLYEKTTGAPITGANVSYYFLGIQNMLKEDASNPGRYYTTLQIDIPPSMEPYSINIIVEKENYSTTTLTISLTVIEKPVNTPWYIQYGWLLGIAVALGAVVAGYKINQKWRERNWERKIDRLYVIHAHDGVAIYERALTKKQMDSQLVSAALMGITGMVKELTASKKKLKAIDHMDKKVIFEYGDKIIGAILAEEDLPIIRKKLREFIYLFEIKYQAQLLGWTGDLSIFKNIDKLTNQVFPFSTIISHREPVPEKKAPLILNQELLGILNAINDGLKEPDLIAAYCEIPQDKIITDLNFLVENGFIDSYESLNLTETGIKAIYHSSEYLKKEQKELEKIDKKTDDKGIIQPIEIKSDDYLQNNKPPILEDYQGNIKKESATKIKKEPKKDEVDMIKPRIPKRPDKKIEFDEVNKAQPRIPKKPDKKIEFDEVNKAQPRIPKRPDNLKKDDQTATQEKTDTEKTDAI